MEETTQVKKLEELTHQERLGNWWPRPDGLWEFDPNRHYNRRMTESDVKREAYAELVRLKRIVGINK